MKKKRYLIITFIYLLLLLTLTTTFAWFFINKEIEVDYDSEITCEAGTSLEVAMLEGIDEETGEEIWTDYSGYVKYTGISAKIEDITGDGKNLYRPTSIVNDTETGDLYPEGLTTANKTNSEGYGEYLEVEIKLRSTSTMNVYFSGDSIVKPITTSDTNKNAFGNFSKDYISGAIRVAVLEKEDDGTENLKMIWAPNPNVHLKYDKSSGKYSLDKSSEYEKYSYYKLNEESGEVEKYYVTSEDYANKKFVLDSTKTTESMVNNSPLLTQLSPSINELVEQRMIIRVWYEGTDREANQALGGGQVKMNLKFIGMSEKQAALEENVNLINGIVPVENEGAYTFDNITNDDNVLFSLDGYTWYEYNTSHIPFINRTINENKENTFIFFKYPESSVNYEYMKSITLIYRGESNA